MFLHSYKVHTLIWRHRIGNVRVKRFIFFIFYDSTVKDFVARSRNLNFVLFSLQVLIMFDFMLARYVLYVVFLKKVVRWFKVVVRCVV
jgi:hypothetical protein